MNKMNRSIYSTLRTAVVFCAFTLTLLVAPSIAFDPQEPDAPERRKREPNQLTFTQIDFPGAVATVVFGLNDRGQIVGFFGDAPSVLHGFLLDNGVFTQIDLPGAKLTKAYGINDRGQIVGGFADAGGICMASSWTRMSSRSSISRVHVYLSLGDQ